MFPASDGRVARERERALIPHFTGPSGEKRCLHAKKMSGRIDDERHCAYIRRSVNPGGREGERIGPRGPSINSRTDPDESGRLVPKSSLESTVAGLGESPESGPSNVIWRVSK